MDAERRQRERARHGGVDLGAEARVRAQRRRAGLLPQPAALAELLSALEPVTAGLAPHRGAVALGWLAWGWCQLDDPARARSLARQAQALGDAPEPTLASADALRGLVATRLGQADEGAAAFQQGLERLRLTWNGRRPRSVKRPLQTWLRALAKASLPSALSGPLIAGLWETIDGDARRLAAGILTDLVEPLCALDQAAPAAERLRRWLDPPQRHARTWRDAALDVARALDAFTPGGLRAADARRLRAELGEPTLGLPFQVGAFATLVRALDPGERDSWIAVCEAANDRYGAWLIRVVRRHGASWPPPARGATLLAELEEVLTLDAKAWQRPLEPRIAAERNRGEVVALLLEQVSEHAPAALAACLDRYLDTLDATPEQRPAMALLRAAEATRALAPDARLRCLSRILDRLDAIRGDPPAGQHVDTSWYLPLDAALAQLPPTRQAQPLIERGARLAEQAETRHWAPRLLHRLAWAAEAAGLDDRAAALRARATSLTHTLDPGARFQIEQFAIGVLLTRPPVERVEALRRSPLIATLQNTPLSDRDQAWLALDLLPRIVDEAFAEG